MNLSQAKKREILRIINSEMREKNLDPKSYREAVKQGLGNSNDIMKHYYKIRFATLVPQEKSMTDPVDEKDIYISTAQCARHLSSRNAGREIRSRKEITRKNLFLEECIANIVLALGASSTMATLWVYNGNTFSAFFFLLLAGSVSMMLLLPSLIAKLKLCSYLSALSLLCMLTALSSFGSGMKLMRDDPTIELSLTEQNTEIPNHLIVFAADNDANSINITRN